MSEEEKLQRAIAALNAQRDTLGDEVVQSIISALQAGRDSQEPVEKRALTTILFADITGFSAFASKLDAEDVQSTLSQLWAELDQIIVSYGGQIDKHMGDRVMAVWGLTQPREDDPAQAVRAALEMQAQAAAFCQQHNITIPMRIGVNTGLVSVGYIESTGERNIIGDTVNIAAGLEHSAPDGSVLIAQSTWEQLVGLFDMQEQPPITVKGKGEPVQTWLVLRSRKRSFFMPTRGLASITTRTIGRDTELGRLQSSYHHARSKNSHQWITVTGEAGVGKSRLLTDFEHWVQSLPEKTHFVKVRAWPHTTNSPYHLLRSLLANHCQINDTDPLAVAQEKLASSLKIMGKKAGEQAATLVGQLIGFGPDPTRRSANGDQSSRQIQRQAEELLEHNLCRLIGADPTVVLLEDLQWADEQSLNLLSTIFSRQQPWPLVIVGAARPSLWERGVRWGENDTHQQLALTALSEEAANVLVHELLQKVLTPPAWLVDLLVERGGGNPYFTEELVKWLIEQGMIETGPQVWHARGDRPIGLSVPGTIQGVLQTRIQQLGEEERAALQRAAVVGVAFWSSAVDYLGQDTVSPELWASLQERGLIIKQEPSQLPGEDEYHFKHELLHDVVYEYTLKKERQGLHKHSAEWLSQVAADRASEWVAVIATHYKEAGEHNLAIEWYERAGKQARGIFALKTAIDYFYQTLNMLPAPQLGQAINEDDARRQVELNQGLGEMLHMTALFPEATEAYLGMLSAAGAIGDQVSQIRAWHKAFICLENTQATMTLAPGEPLYGDSDEYQQLMALRLNLLGALYQMLGCQQETDPYMESMLSLLKESEFPTGNETATTLNQRALEIAQKVGNTGGIMLCMTNRGQIQVKQGRFGSAAADLLQVIQLSERFDWYGIPETHRLLAETYLGEKQPTKAATSAQEALSRAKKVSDLIFMGRAWLTLGRVAAQSTDPITVDGQPYDPSACFAQSEQAFKEQGSKVERAHTLSAWAEHELEQGNHQLGSALQQRSRVIFTQLGLESSGS